MKKHLFGLITLIAFTPAAAHADFSGLYGGAEIGYANVDVDFDILEAGETSVDGDGIVYGGFLGFRQSLTGLVLGIEGRLSDTTAKTELSEVDFTASSSESRQLGVSAIAGFAPGDRFMLFGLVGYENVKTDILADGESESQSNSGIRYGVGVEMALLPMVSIRGIVSRTDYGKELSLESAADLGVQSDRTQTEATVGAVLSF